MKPISTTLAYEGLGFFLIDNLMDVEFVCGETSLVWKSHISKYNHREYPGLFKEFCGYMSEHGCTDTISYSEFTQILETVFQAYCLLR